MPGSHVRYQSRKCTPQGEYRNSQWPIANAILPLNSLLTMPVFVPTRRSFFEFYRHGWNCHPVGLCVQRFLLPSQLKVYSVSAVVKNKIHVFWHRMCGVSLTGQAKFFNGPDAHFIPLGNGVAFLPGYSYSMSHDHRSANIMASRSCLNWNTPPPMPIQGLNPDGVVCILAASQRMMSGP